MSCVSVDLTSDKLPPINYPDKLRDPIAETSYDRFGTKDIGRRGPSSQEDKTLVFSMASGWSEKSCAISHEERR
jgi:hypothetical protein